MGKLLDLTGQRFGKLIVINRVENTKVDNATQWLCQCDCGNTSIVRTRNLCNGSTKSCGCAKSNDLTNQRFGKLVVLEYYGAHKNNATYWKCKCDCGNIKLCRSYSLLNGINISCGKCSYNTFEIKDDYIIGITKQGVKFYFDKIDYDLINKHTWRTRKDSTKGLMCTINKEVVLLHRFIMKAQDNQVVDHIDGNPLNNRRYNLRICTIQENSCNQKLHKNNTSGITGVWWNNSAEKWVAEILSKGVKYRKSCISFIEAVIQRLKWEVELFQEFRSTRNDKRLEEILNEYGYTLNQFIKNGGDTN